MPGGGRHGRGRSLGLAVSLVSGVCRSQAPFPCGVGCRPQPDFLRQGALTTPALTVLQVGFWISGLGANGELARGVASRAPPSASAGPGAGPAAWAVMSLVSRMPAEA